MENDLLSNNEPITFEPYAADLSVSSGDLIEVDNIPSSGVSSSGSDSAAAAPVVDLPDNLLTNDIFLSGINELVNTIDPESVNEEVVYVDRGTVYNSGDSLPDYAVVYDCNGVEVVFPTGYADDIIIVDGVLINLGSNYTAGLQIDGYNVSNYLSSEITIPTYHSATWYQYMQSYGQPYRIVDRYVNNYGSISSSTRDSVSVEWSGGNPWEGFTFDRAAMFIVIAVLLVMLVFRKGKV